jgi:hypothetical protein
MVDHHVLGAAISTSCIIPGGVLTWAVERFEIKEVWLEYLAGLLLITGLLILGAGLSWSRL